VKALVIGGGGADHAVTWKLTKSLAVTAAYAAPGNYGTHLVGANLNIPPTDPESLAQWAGENQIDLTLVNDPVALAFGAVDVFQAQGLRVFGPSQSAARLESDKGWAKSFLERHGIPTPPGREFSRLDEAEGYLAAARFPVVLKSSHREMPTNVVVARRHESAVEAVRAILAPVRRGPANSVLIEDYVDGEVCSVLVVTDGETARVLGTASVYFSAERGSEASIIPGMGVISPARGVSDPSEEVLDRIIRPVLAGLASEGVPYMGAITARVMLTRGGPAALSFKTRFSDPEAQAILPRWQDDLYIVADAVLDRALNDLAPFKWSNEQTCGVVVASEGYPNEVETGYGILGLSETGNSTTIFHNGTRDPYQKPVGLITPTYDRASTGRLGRPGGISSWLVPSRSRSKQLDAQATRVSRDPYSQIVTADGRVLTVVGQGKTREDARQNAYRAVARISFTGCWNRSDIGEEPREGQQ